MEFISRSKPIAPEELALLSHQRIDHDWFKAPAPYEIEFVVARDPKALYFRVQVQSLPHADLLIPAGTFREGLAEQQDVAEIFFKDKKSSRYQEFHVSPSGAWWSASFESYRVRESPSYLPKNITTFAEVRRVSWSAWLRIPLSEIVVDCGLPKTLTANVTFILGAPQQQFYSWATLPSEQPDFHKLS